MIAAEGKIKAKEDVEVIDLDRADSQVMGRGLEQHGVNSHRLLDTGRIHMAAGKALGLEAHPAVRMTAALFLEIEFAAVVFPEPGHPRITFLHALEQVQQRLTIVRQRHLRPQPHVHVEVFAKCVVRMRHTNLPVPLALQLVFQLPATVSKQPVRRPMF